MVCLRKLAAMALHGEATLLRSIMKCLSFGTALRHQLMQSMRQQLRITMPRMQIAANKHCLLLLQPVLCSRAAMSAVECHLGQGMIDSRLQCAVQARVALLSAHSLA